MLFCVVGWWVLVTFVWIWFEFWCGVFTCCLMLLMSAGPCLIVLWVVCCVFWCLVYLIRLWIGFWRWLTGLCALFWFGLVVMFTLWYFAFGVGFRTLTVCWSVCLLYRLYCLCLLICDYDMFVVVWCVLRIGLYT